MSSPSPEEDVDFVILSHLSPIFGTGFDSLLDSDDELDELLSSSSSSSCGFSGLGEVGFGFDSGVFGLSMPLPFGDFGKLPGNSVFGLRVASR
jgi:hypothetical protein